MDVGYCAFAMGPQFVVFMLSLPYKYNGSVSLRVDKFVEGHTLR